MSKRLSGKGMTRVAILPVFDANGEKLIVRSHPRTNRAIASLLSFRCT
ncbi:hypothetical protein NDA03_25225 [Trichocoleus sp. Lan]